MTPEIGSEEMLFVFFFPCWCCISGTDVNHASMLSIHYLTSHPAGSTFRAGIMYTCSDGKLKKQLRSSMFSLSGTGFFGAVGRSLGLGMFMDLAPYSQLFIQVCVHSRFDSALHCTGGQTALALRLLLAAFSSKLSSEINRPFGDEVLSLLIKSINKCVLKIYQVINFCFSSSSFFILFVSPYDENLDGWLDLQFRAARKAAEEIGAQMVIGDRPIEITVCTLAHFLRTTTISLWNCYSHFFIY